MISDEEKELIATREKWADFPIINFWHNTKLHEKSGLIFLSSIFGIILTMHPMSFLKNC